MMMSDGIKIVYPPITNNRGPGYWMKWKNIWESRRKIFRADHSNEWRYSFSKINPEPINRSIAFSELLNEPVGDSFKFIILGDTGEGDRSQYALLPLIRVHKPDFMIINGDVAYPAGREEDFMAGFFEPYRGFNIPIWAVPGNHEYYSKYRGQEFYDIFCTYKWARVWEEYGLRFVKQPGTYWELTDNEGRTTLVVIGIDTGMSGDLDGYKVGNPVDREQLSWLNGRLKIAEKAGKKVIILFHIPALANQKLIKKTHLFQLHFLIAKYSCVKMVIGAHQHNHQRYSPEVFRRFLNEVAPAAQSKGNIIH
jgi:3',5'-cyclic AMP phosphodiesterase CpdA